MKNILFIIIAAIICTACVQTMAKPEPVAVAEIPASTSASSNTSSSTKAGKDTLLTSEVYEAKDGTTYPIIVNKKSGRCYIWKKSGNTGKDYKMYMKPTRAKEVCDKYGIPYKE